MKNIITIQHTQSVHHTNGMIGSWKFLNQGQDKKHRIRKLSDMSYIKVMSSKLEV